MDALKTINITFNNAKRQADRLNDCALQMQKLQSRLDALGGDLQRSWSGDAANAFLAKCSALRDKINSTAADINKVSSTLRAAANIYYNAEMKALEIANTRE